MLGKKSSLKMLLRVLRREGVSNVHSTRFVQGAGTVRWGLAWSFWQPAMGKGCDEEVAPHKVFGAKKKEGRDGLLSRDVAVMSAHKMVETSRAVELQAASSVTWTQFEKDSCNVLSLASAAGVQRVLTASDMCELDVNSAPSEPGNSLFADEVESKSSKMLPLDVDAAVQLKSVALLCLCLGRIKSVLGSLGNNAHEARYDMDSSNIEYRNGNTVIVPLMRPDEQEGVVHTCRVSVSSEKEVRLTLTVQEAGGRPASSATRAAFFRFVSAFEADWLRSNRRWRRSLALSGISGVPSSESAQGSDSGANTCC